MITELQVILIEGSSKPHVTVPGEDMWDLQEFLFWRGVRTACDFGARFTIYFPHLDRDTAQSLIDDWLRLRNSARTMGAETSVAALNPVTA